MFPLSADGASVSPRLSYIRRLLLMLDGDDTLTIHR